MKELVFNKAEVLNLITHATASEEYRGTYNSKDDGPALHLVGDQGIYLMSNGLPMQENTDGKMGALVAYAEGTNPNEDEDYYENKRFLYGGDDGVDSIPVKEFTLAIRDSSDKIVVRLSSTSISIVAGT